MFYSASSLGREVARFGRNWWETLRVFVLLSIAALIIIMITERADVTIIALAGLGVLLIGTVIYRLVNKKRIVVYEGGIGYRTREGEKTWSWSQFTHMDGTRHTQSVNGIPMAKWGANHFYTGEGKAFSVQSNTASPDRIVYLMLAKIAQNYLPLVMNDIQAGKSVKVSGFPVDREGLQTNKGKVPWSDVKRLDIRNNYMRLERLSEKHKIHLGELNNGGNFVLLGVLDNMLGTRRLDQIVDDNMSGRHYLLGIPKFTLQGLALVVGLIVLGVGGVSAMQAYQTAQANSAYDHLVNTYGADALALCDVKPRGKLSAVGEIKVFVIDTVSRRVYEDYQKLLDPKLVAQNRDEATVAICVTPNYERYETCEYGDEDKSVPSFTIERFLTSHDLTVIDVRNGKRAYTDVLYGLDPAECPDSAKASAKDIYGAPPTAEEFAMWVEEYLKG